MAALHERIDLPNLLVKVPGTAAGVPAIEESIAAGHSVNVTLLFSVERHMECAGAYLRGLRRALDAGLDVSRIVSVASFFVSRVDTLVDDLLAKDGSDAALALQGTAAVANAKLAYEAFRERFSGPAWDELAAAGATVQRPLWASTSTKNPEYSDILYVQPLIGPDTVNTLTAATIEAFKQNGRPAVTIGDDLEDACDDGRPGRGRHQHGRRHLSTRARRCGEVLLVVLGPDLIGSREASGRPRLIPPGVAQAEAPIRSARVAMPSPAQVSRPSGRPLMASTRSRPGRGRPGPLPTTSRCRSPRTSTRHRSSWT